MANPGREHWAAAKRILRYLKGASDTKLTFHGGLDIQLWAAADADWAGDTASRRSQSGILMLLCGAAILGVSRRQPTVALSSAESEAGALSEVVKAVEKARIFLNQIPGCEQTGPTITLQDNQATVALANSGQGERNRRHIDIRIKKVIELQLALQVALVWVPSAKQLADVLTKPLTAAKFNDGQARINGKIIIKVTEFIDAATLHLRAKVSKARTEFLTHWE